MVHNNVPQCKIRGMSLQKHERSLTISRVLRKIMFIHKTPRPAPGIVDLTNVVFRGVV